MFGLCNLYLQQFLFFYIQTLHNNCSHIKDVHLLFVHISWFFLHFFGLELRYFLSKMLRGCLISVFCNSNSFHSLIFKLFIMIVGTLNMCSSYFVHIWSFFFLGLLDLDILFIQMLRGCLVCVICNSSSFYAFIFKLCILQLFIHWTYIPYIFCTFDNMFGSVHIRHYYVYTIFGVLTLCNLCVICN